MKKRKSTIQFNIPEPCNEPLSDMTPVKGGRFCHQCDRHIVNFTNMTDTELARYYQQHDGKICGVFSPDQLGRDITLPRPQSKLNRWKAAAAVTAGLFLSNGALAQTTQNREYITVERQVLSQMKAINSEEGQVIEGIITDENTGEVLIGANLVIENTTIGVTTDIDGFFSIRIPVNIIQPTIIVSYVGYEPFYINEIDNLDFLHIEMNANITLNAVEIVGYKHSSVRGLIAGAISTMMIVNQEKNDNSNIGQYKLIKESHAYPNPFNTSFSFNINIKKADYYLVHLYDIDGRLMYAETFHLMKGKQDITLESLPPNLASGQYILQVSNGNDILLTEKIVKADR